MHSPEVTCEEDHSVCECALVHFTWTAISIFHLRRQQKFLNQVIKNRYISCRNSKKFGKVNQRWIFKLFCIWRSYKTVIESGVWVRKYWRNSADPWRNVGPEFEKKKLKSEKKCVQSVNLVNKGVGCKFSTGKMINRIKRWWIEGNYVMKLICCTKVLLKLCRRYRGSFFPGFSAPVSLGDCLKFSTTTASRLETERKCYE